MTETSTEPYTIGGRPVTGEISRYGTERDVPQKPIEDFVAALDLMFALGATGAFWHQYTPYFNDGDPCVFTVHDVEFRFPDTPEDAGDYENGFESPYTFSKRHKLAAEVYKDHFAYKSIETYNNAMNRAFGDPAEVTATPDGFSVEYYDHD